MRREKNRVIYSTQTNVQKVKNIEVTSSIKREVIEVTQISTQKARLVQIELLNKLNKCKITQEPYCYKVTLALMPQNAQKPSPQLEQGINYSQQQVEYGRAFRAWKET